MTGLALILGLTEAASVAALILGRTGRPVALAADAPPRAHRRGMCLADAWWDGKAELDGMTARLCDPRSPPPAGIVPVYRLSAQEAVRTLFAAVLIDARLAKRDAPPDLRELAPLTIGCGPGHAAGAGAHATCHVAIETGWGPDLGRVLHEGPTRPLAGEPRVFEGVGRERIVYAPAGGILHANKPIGAPVSAGEVVARIGAMPVAAPIAGTIRGLMRPGLVLRPRDKVLEIDPRPPERALFTGPGARPTAIATGICAAVAELPRAPATSLAKRSANEGRAS